MNCISNRLVVLTLAISSSLSATIINVPADSSTIQSALNGAVDGDTVLVQPGTYPENIIWPDVNGIKLISAGDSSNTIIDGGGIGSVIFMDSSTATIDSTTEIQGFKITNGGGNVSQGSRVSQGGGLFISSASPLLTRLWVTGNTASSGYDVYGGGLYIVGGSPTLTGVMVSGNTAASGNYGYDGGDGNGGGLYIAGGSPTLTDVTVTGNTASGTSGYGGGIYCSSSSPSFDPINRSNIYLNYATSSGNDLYAYSPIEVVVDTFTVMIPTNAHVYPVDNFTFDILHAKVEQVAADLYVNPAGDDTNSGQSASDPLRTIASAYTKILADSLIPRTIYLANGMYSPAMTGEPFPLAMVDHVSLSGESESGVILDGEGQSGVMVFYQEQGITVENLTITGGSARYGGGLYIWNSSPTLTHVTVSGNTATGNGGGLYIKDGSPALTNVTVTGNMAHYEGGGFLLQSSEATLTDVTVTGNTSGPGGGLYLEYGSPTLTHVTVAGNTAPDGGGLFIYDSSPTLTDVTVTGNTATRPSSGYGGGLFIFISSPTLTDVAITGNTATGYGGGLCVYDSSPTLTNMTVTGNTATRDGGGLFINGPNSPTLTDVTVTGNTATRDGGGLYITNKSVPTLTRVTVSRNLGEGLYLKEYSGALVRNVTITGNTRGIYIESGATPTIAGSNITYNGTGLHNADNTNTIDADSVWWGHSSGPNHPQHNPGGLGDSVNAYVDITPFLTEPDTAAPPVPVQNLHATSTSATSISLAWDSSPLGDFAGFKVYYDSDSSGYPYTNSIDVGTDTSYSLGGLSLGTTFYLAVTCYDTDGNESWYSKELAVTVGDHDAPDTPQGLTGVAGDGEVLLSWHPSPAGDFGGYRIYGGAQPSPGNVVDSTGSAQDTSITISNLVNGTIYYFRVTAVDTLLNESGFSNEIPVTPGPLSVETEALPTVFALHQNYPNPFNPTSTIQYDLPEAANVTLVVYDILGHEVIRLVSQEMQPGYHVAVWDAKDHAGRAMPTGIYLARVVTPAYTKSIKMLLLK